MPGVVPRYTTASQTYEVVEQVTGGQLVEARAASKIGVAGAGSAKCLGIARGDALPAGTAQDSTDVFGNPVIQTSPVNQYVTVSRAECYRVKYAAAASFGDLLKTAALGQVTPWVSGTDAAGLIIGRCVEPAGVALGALGDTDIF